MYKHISKETFKERAKKKDQLTNKEWAKLVNYTFLVRQKNSYAGQKIYTGSTYK